MTKILESKMLPQRFSMSAVTVQPLIFFKSMFV